MPLPARKPTGLDRNRLILELHRLVDGEDCIVGIDHDLDVVAKADSVSDLGPVGGGGAGQMVLVSPLAQVVKSRTKPGAALESVWCR